ncbi:hypothetical protein QEZ54_12355 [Catellatospora sp. KI3]|uniref:hypothetical protein n=1 Tax=Catellatospora sp. KI3 TaxID=3041620 RepID=UPI0024822A35|nr:hypothetical protein [Catellatospora sp. KI3]MDI1461767.1 hypothetical protein [Catellatospora sp. KI3]
MTENAAGVPEADALEQAALADPLADEDLLNALPDQPIGAPEASLPPASEWDQVEQRVVAVPAEDDYV